MTDTSKDLVSIVIPTYNHAEYLGKCLDSVLRQTYRNWEAIVVNNHSQDNTAEVVGGFSDPRIRMIDFKNNGIIAASRNEGIRQARGEFIAFLDSDDSWYPEKLKRCLEKLEAGADLVSHGMCYIKDGKRWKDVMCGPAKMAEYSNLLYNGSCITISATIVRKKNLESVFCFDEDPAIVTAEDYELWLKLAKGKIRTFFINDVLGEYACHDKNLSKQTIRHLEASLTVINKHFAQNEKHTFLDILRFRRIKALFLYGAARSFQNDERRSDSLKFFLKSMAVFPFLPRIYGGILLSIFSFLRLTRYGHR